MTTKKVTKSQFLSIVYHDLFDFPLTQTELEYWQVGKLNLPKYNVNYSNNLYYLQGREWLVYKRFYTSKQSEEKYIKAKEFSEIFKNIPTIEYIGITGGLSMGNVKKEDDIDIIIITSKNCVWSTRFAVYFIAKLCKLNIRKPNDKKTEDKICLNLWLEEDSLSFKHRKDIYTAHEILQVKTLFDRKNLYRKLVKKNIWIKQFFPNAYKHHIKNIFIPSNKINILYKIVKYTFVLFNNISMKIQLKIMKNKITRELVTAKMLLFHPGNWSLLIPRMYLKKLEQELVKTKYYKQNNATFSETS